MIIDYDKLPRKGRTNAIYINKLAIEKGYKLYQLDYYTGMVSQKDSMVEYIDALHDKIDFLLKDLS